MQVRLHQQQTGDTHLDRWLVQHVVALFRHDSLMHLLVQLLVEHFTVQGQGDKLAMRLIYPATKARCAPLLMGHSGCALCLVLTNLMQRDDHTRRMHACKQCRRPAGTCMHHHHQTYDICVKHADIAANTAANDYTLRNPTSTTSTDEAYCWACGCFSRPCGPAAGLHKRAG